jgi:preprotein translocase subunit SecG
MFTSIILVVHIMVCIALVLIILLQSGKGADIGAAFGGGSSQTVFGSTGATSFLSKVTVGAAVLFMCTSIILTYFSGKSAQPVEHSVMSGKTVPQAPATPAGPSTAPQPAKTAPATGAPATPAKEAPATPATPAAPATPAPSTTPAPAPSAPAPAAPAPEAPPAGQK